MPLTLVWRGFPCLFREQGKGSEKLTGTNKKPDWRREKYSCQKTVSEVTTPSSLASLEFDALLGRKKTYRRGEGGWSPQASQWSGRECREEWQRLQRWGRRLRFSLRAQRSSNCWKGMLQGPSTVSARVWRWRKLLKAAQWGTGCFFPYYFFCV